MFNHFLCDRTALWTSVSCSSECEPLVIGACLSLNFIWSSNILFKYHWHFQEYTSFFTFFLGLHLLHFPCNIPVHCHTTDMYKQYFVLNLVLCTLSYFTDLDIYKKDSKPNKNPPGNSVPTVRRDSIFATSCNSDSVCKYLCCSPTLTQW